jgi:FkbM family methyltransferase
LVKTEHGLFTVDQEDLTVGWKLRRNAQYGSDELKWLEPYLNQEADVLVVGAHIGSLAIPISRKCKEVVAIEANPHTFQLLSQNILLNQIRNCIAFNIAASNKTETISFLMNKVNSGGSKRVPVHKEQMYYYDNPAEIHIQAYSLDEYMPDRNFGIVVMDIEGSEYFALKGMQSILSNASVLAIEFLPHHLKNVSDVSVETFLSLISPHFSSLRIPSKNKTVSSSDFLTTLSSMFEANQEEDMIFFSK